jgi:hypothetical protein
MAIISVEAIVEESRWSLLEKPAIIGLRVDFQETELQLRVKQAGGRWNSVRLGSGAWSQEMDSEAGGI